MRSTHIGGLPHITSGAAHPVVVPELLLVVDPVEVELVEVEPVEVELVVVEPVVVEPVVVEPEVLVDPEPPEPPEPGVALNPLPHAATDTAADAQPTINQGNAASRIWTSSLVSGGLEGPPTVAPGQQQPFQSIPLRHFPAALRVGARRDPCSPCRNVCGRRTLLRALVTAVTRADRL